MQKLYFVAWSIAGIFTCLTFPSCSKEDNPDDSKSILGTWNCYEIYEENPDPFTYWGDEIDYPYMVINDKYLSFNDEPSMVTTSGELYSYTYNAQSKTIFLLDLDLSTHQPYDEDPIILHITKLTSDELWFEWDVNGYYELFKYKRYK